MRPVKLSSVRKKILIQFLFLLGLFRSLIFFHLRGTNCPSTWLTQTAPCQSSDIAVELIFWAAAIILVVLELFWDHAWEGYLQAMKSNGLVLGFVGLAALSLIWSIIFNVSLYRFLVLASSTLTAIYIGYTYRLEKILKSLVWAYFAICLFCLMTVIFIPNRGIMSDPFYKGAWNGIFWHRNYLGCFMALGITVFLVNLFSSKKPFKAFFYMNLGMLVVSSFLLVKSKSATGFISAIVLAALCLIVFAWIKWHQKLRKIHYLGFLGVALVAVIVILANLDFIFGLLGRNTSLTGRVPMWEYLFKHVINLRPWLGYGYGAIWYLQGFREELSQILNWGAPVLIGDNGFLDILLHLGVVGVATLLTLVVMSAVRGVKYLLHTWSVEAAFPILMLAFGLVANISLSLILETEEFMWIVTLAVLTSIPGHSGITRKQ